MGVEDEEARRAAEAFASARAEELELAPEPPALAPVPDQRPKLYKQPALPRRARTPLPSVSFVAISILLGVAGLALWAAFYTFELSSVQEHRSQRVLYGEFRAQVAEQTAPIGNGSIPKGVPVAALDIPRVGLHHVMVVEGTSSVELESGPGHRRDSPLPGEEGTSYLLGRSRSFGAPFARIAGLKQGDSIKILTGQGNFTFNVDAVRRAGDSLTPFYPGAARLTLVTSVPAKGGARQVVYVDATLKGTAQPASTGRPTRLPIQEDQLQADQRAVTPILLWLGASLLVVAALAWVSTRWGFMPTVLVGTPMLIALAWGVAEAGTHLLPNLF